MTTYTAAAEFPYLFGSRRSAGSHWRRMVHQDVDGRICPSADRHASQAGWLLDRLSSATWRVVPPRFARVEGVAPVGMTWLELAACGKCRPQITDVLAALGDWRESQPERLAARNQQEVEAAEARRLAADRGRAVEACRGRNHLIGVTVPAMATDELRRRHAEEFDALLAERRLRARVNGWLAEFLVRGE